MNQYPNQEQAQVPLETLIVEIKVLRRDIDIQIQKVKELPRCREQALCITKLQEAVMWLGMNLKIINDENPGLCENP